MVRGYDIPTYPYRRAPEQDGAGRRHPVAIVGGGLVGLTLALDLAQRGVPVVVLDDDDTVGVRGAASRGVCYARRSLEIFDRFGIYDRIAGKGATWRFGRVMRDDECLYTFTLPDGADRKHPPFVNLQQYYVEQFLVERIADFPHADLRWKHEVTGARGEADRVRLDVATPDGPYALEAAWVVACDGANSRVRRALGAEPLARATDDTWLIVDFWLGADLPNERTVWLEAADNDGRAVWFHRMGDDVWRLDFQIGPRAAAEAMNREALAADIVRRMLRKIVGRDPPFELVWIGPWTYRSFVLDRFRIGRVLFAGDAAHLMSPFGARGGNSGIQDADNLGWKLAGVLAGRAPETLLDSYDAERRPAALENVTTTDRTAAFLHPPHAMARRFRRAVMDLSRDLPFARGLANGGRLSVPNVYRDSPLSSPDRRADALPPALAPGYPAINLRLAEDRGAPFLFDSTKGEFATVWTGARQTSMPAGALVLDTMAARAAYGEGLYLLRPDGHVAWRSPAPDAAGLAAARARAGGQG